MQNRKLLMKVLVTGGAGFIGSHLVDRLIREGHTVTIVDNLSTGKRENLNPKAKFVKVDIREEALAELFRSESPEYVFHFAAQIDVRKAVENPIFDAQVNVLGTLNLLENSFRHRVKKFIFASTGGALYGETEKLPSQEDDPLSPLSPYGVAKLACEQYICSYGFSHSLRYTIFRYGNVYGPRQDPLGEAGVVAIFTRLMLEEKNPIVYGYGKMWRDYVYVGDVVEATLLALEKGDNEIYNIGTGIGTSVQDLYTMMKAIIEFKGKPIYKEARKGEIKRSTLDCQKAKKELNWSPKVSLEEGLKRTIAWFKEASTCSVNIK